MVIIFFLALLFSPLAAEIPKEEGALRVMSFNIRYSASSDTGERDWGKRYPRIVKLIKEYRPDIIGFQEVEPLQLLVLYHYLEGYTYFGEPRKGYTFYFYPSGEYNPIFYKKSRFEILDSGTFWLNAKMKPVEKGWDATDYRISTSGEFFDKKTEGHFWVFNTHLDHQGREARREGLKLIASEALGLSEGLAPVLIMGDFNTAYLSIAVEGFTDTRTLAEKTGGPNATFNGWGDTAHSLIDFILLHQTYGSEYRVLNHTVHVPPNHAQYPLSDHFPVILDLLSR